MTTPQSVLSRFNRRLAHAFKVRTGAGAQPQQAPPSRLSSLACAVARASRGSLLASSSVSLALVAGALALPDTAYAQAVMRGVERLPGGKWSGAKAPTVAVTNTGFRATIEQTQQKALLDWRKFNIQNGDEVFFNQEATDWIAFNRIWDVNPTLIDGAITAKGQVYLMNTNGLIFGENARINVNTLLATTNNLSEEQFQVGIGNRRPRTESTGAAFNDFRSSPENRSYVVDVSNAGPDGVMGTADDFVEQIDFGFTRIADPAARLQAYTEQSRVVVEAGARIVAGASVQNVSATDAGGNPVVIPQIAEGAGAPGKIMLFGTNVSNAGVLDAGVNGQVILAAGEHTYLLPSLEPSFRRGFDVEVSPAGGANTGFQLNRLQALENKVENSGAIIARQGNISMVGADIDQLGEVTATSAGVLNGLIELRATTGASVNTSNGNIRAIGGTVRFGEGSVTAVVPEAGGPGVAAGQAVAASQISVHGQKILLQSDSTVVTPGGKVDMIASVRGDGQLDSVSEIFEVGFSSTRSPARGFIGDIILEQGARLDVSGIDGLELSVKDLIVPVDIESNELANVPRQQDGVLDGTTVYVDITKGTRVADWTGALGTRLLSSQERALAGGEINLTAFGSVVVDRGAQIDISGGSASYRGDYIQTTRLRLEDGRWVDISAASPDLTYTEVSRSDPYFVDGFSRGFDAGSLTILAPGLYLAGDLDAGVTPGERQLGLDGARGRLPFTPPAPVGLRLDDDGSVSVDSALQPVNALPRGGSVRIGEADFVAFGPWQSDHMRIVTEAPDFAGSSAEEIASSLVDVDYEADEIIRRILRIQNIDTVLDSQGIVVDDFISGSGAAALYVGNRIQDAQDRRFSVADNVRLALSGSGALQLQVGQRNDRVIQVGENVSLISPGGEISIGEVDFGSGLLLDVSGGWYNDLAPGGDPLALPYIDGGLINLSNVQFAGTATLDISGGARNRVTGAAGADGRTPFAVDLGQAGAVVISESVTGREGAFSSEQFDNLRILGAGFAGSGSLSLSLGDADIVITDTPVAAAERQPGVFYFSDERLNGLGLAELAFLQAGDVTIGAGVQLTLQQQTLVLDDGFETAVTGTDIYSIATPQVLTRRRRMDIYGSDNAAAPLATTLRFAQHGNDDLFSFDASAQIALDPGSRIALRGAERLLLDGAIEAPGAAVEIQAGLVWLGETARLTARGYAESYRDPRRQTLQADLLDGGDIRIDAGLLYTTAGSLIDVSGADAVPVDVLTRLRSGVIMRRKAEVGGDAGSIALNAQGGFVSGELRGAAGRNGARAGSLLLQGGGDAGSSPAVDAVQLESFLENLFAGYYGYQDLFDKIYEFDFYTFEYIYLFGENNRYSFGEDYASIDAILEKMGLGAQDDFEALPTPFTERTGSRGILRFFGEFVFDEDIDEQTDAGPLAQILLSSLPQVESGGLRLTDGDSAPADLTPEQLFALFNEGPGLDDIIAQIGAPDADLYQIRNSQEAFANTAELLLRMADPDVVVASPGLSVDIASFDGGFDTLTFNGDLNAATEIDIAARRQINLPGTILGGTADMTFSAPYVTWGDQTAFVPFSSVDSRRSRFDDPEARELAAQNGVLTINAGHVDFTGIVRGTRNFSAITVNSQGDIRAVDYGTVGAGQGGLQTTDQLEPGGGLRSAAPITFNAAQIYPGSSADMIISSGHSVSIGQTRPRRLAGPALSAGGTLRVAAPLIEQGGTLRAPQGSITLAGEQVQLLSGSLTSAALDGLYIPYGVVVQNDNWLTDTSDPNDLRFGGESIDTPPQREVVFAATDVTIASDATVDISGGGDVLARQFVAGPQGSVDIIRDRGQAFAIVPAFGSQVAAPIAPGTLGSGERINQLGGVGSQFGLQVTLSGGNGIPAGTYTVLPAEYAIVPGAYLLEPAGGSQLASTFTTELADGSALMSGYFSVADTAIADGLSQSFRVSSFQQLSERADYTLFSGNSFFTSEAFRLRLLQSGLEPDLGVRSAADGGRFAFDLDGSLTIEDGAQILSAGVEGARGGVGDIVSERVALIAEPLTDADIAGRDQLLADGYLVLTTADLEAIGANSLLFGGSRRQTAEGTVFDVAGGAETVIVDTSAADPLRAQEIMLIARDRVVVGENSVIQATGAAVADDSRRILGLTDAGDLSINATSGNVDRVNRQAENISAFVQVSSAASGDIVRQLSDSEGEVGREDGVTVTTVLASDARGDVTVAGGARLEAEGSAAVRSSVVFDGSRDVQFLQQPGAADDITILADRLIAGASVVNLGDPGAPVSGLTLSQAALDSLSRTVDDLSLTSRTSINVFGDVALTVQNGLRLDSDEIAADSAGGSLAIVAGAAQFVSSSPAVDDVAAAPGSGLLSVTVSGDSHADLQFGGGEKTFSGFGEYRFDVAGQVIFSGEDAALGFDADTGMAAQRFSVTRGSSVAVNADGALSFATVEAAAIGGGALPAIADIENVGATLQVAADSLSIDSAFQARSGLLSFSAASGDLALGSRARLDASGQTLAFYDRAETFDAGVISLVAAQGDIIVNDGALISVAGGSDGGDAGTLAIEAASGTALLDGEFLGTAAAGFDGGSFTLAAAGGQGGFSAVNTLLDDGGFNNQRRFRFTSGDVVIDRDIAVNALEVIADAGDITIGDGVVAVNINTTGEQGGTVRFAAGGDLVLRDGVSIDASAKGEGDRDGGRILLEIDDADLGDRIRIGSGVTLNVAAAGDGLGGRVYARAPQLSGGDRVAVASFDADVLGGPAIVEAYKSYEDVAVVDDAFIATAEADAAAFMSAGNLTAVYDRLGKTTDLDFQIWAGIEARSSADMTFVGAALSLDEITGTPVANNGEPITDAADLPGAWNLAELRFDDPRAGAAGAAAGALLLRAAGELSVQGNISDGFIDPLRTADWSASGPPAMELSNDAAWHINLVAGADLNSADTRALDLAADGGIRVGTATRGALVRSGSGDIHLHAAGDIELTTAASVIYTAGTQSAAIADFEVPTVNNAGESLVAYYPENGGDIVIEAGGDIIGPGSINNIGYRQWLIMRGAVTGEEQRFNNNLTLQPGEYSADVPFYLYDNGTPDDSSDDRLQQTSAWIAFDEFRQGVATFGGGDIRIEAGGDMDDFSASIARTTRVAGGTQANPEKTPVYTGGGEMTVSVGGDISGSSFWVGAGTMAIDAGGAIGESTRVEAAATMVFLGDTRASVTAGGDIQLGGIASATSVSQGLNFESTRRTFARTRLASGVDAGPRYSQWVDYSKQTRIAVTSSGGDLLLQSRPEMFSHMPGLLTFRAPNGSVIFQSEEQPSGSVQQIPFSVDAHENTAVNVFARDNIDFRSRFVIGDADYDVFPRVHNPLLSLSDGLAPFLVTTPNTYLQEDPSINPLDVLANQSQITGGVFAGSEAFNRFYTLQGDITIDRSLSAGAFFGNDPTRVNGVVMRNESRFIAGDDLLIEGLLTVQNNDADDLSLFRAADDIVFSGLSGTSLIDQGLGLLLLWGPGRAVVEAGDNVIFGRAAPSNFRSYDLPDLGIFAPGLALAGSDGRSFNPYLERAGTDMAITVMSGIDREPQYQSFLDRYVLDPAAAPDYVRQVSETLLDIDELRVLRDAQLADSNADGQTTAVTIYAIDLVNFIRTISGEETLATRDDNGRPLSRAEQLALVSEQEYAAAVARLQELDPELQKSFAYEVLFSELRIRGREAVGASPDTDIDASRQGDPSAGYDAIAALFPGAQRRRGDTLAAGETAWLGDIVMQDATIRTAGGGDINLLVPGGRLQQTPLNFTQRAAPGNDFAIEPTDPANSGIVTLTGGNINALTNGNYDVNSSRTLTVFGGDVLIWSSYGDIDAGRGRRDVFSAPPVEATTSFDGVTEIGIAAVPFGSGIGALELADGSPGGEIDLFAFNGVVNAGDAGIRARTIVIGALQILGLDNVRGDLLTNVEIDIDGGELGPLNLQNFAQEAIERALDDALEVSEELEQRRMRRTTILTGELIGIEDAGGDSGDNP